MPRRGFIEEIAQQSTDYPAPTSGSTVIYSKTDGEYYYRLPDGTIKRISTNIDLLKKQQNLGWYDAVQDFGADNTGATNTTTAIQNALNYAFANGGGTIFFRKGIYKISGSLGTYNSQLYVPGIYASQADLPVIMLLGEVAPQTNAGILNAYTLPTDGVIFNSTISSTGDVLGSAYGTSGELNAVQFDMQNIHIRTVASGNMSAFNGKKLHFLGGLKGCRFDTDTAPYAMSLPNSAKTGIITPEIGNGAYTVLRDIVVSGYYTAIEVNEHTNGDNVNIHGCYRGLDFKAADQASIFNRVLFNGCAFNIYLSGSHRFRINQFNTEHYPSSVSTKWYNFQYDVYEASGTSYADISYHVVRSFFGIANGDWLQSTSSNIKANPIGVVSGGGDVYLAADNAFTGNNSINTTSPHISLNCTDTSLGSPIYDFGAASAFYLQRQNANANTVLQIITKGTGLAISSRFLAAQLHLYNTDIKADPTNYNGLFINGWSDVINVSSAAAGSKSSLPLTFEADNSASHNQIILNVDGTITLGKIAGTGTRTLGLDSSNKIVTVTGGGGGSSQWTTGGSDIYYNTGFVGIGTASPAQLLHIVKTTDFAAIGLMESTFGSSGNGAAVWRVKNDVGTIAQIGVYNSGNTGYGAIGAGESHVYSGAALTIMADGGAVKIAADGNAEVARFNSAGLKLGVVGNGTTTQMLTINSSHQITAQDLPNTSSVTGTGGSMGSGATYAAFGNATAGRVEVSSGTGIASGSVTIAHVTFSTAFAATPTSVQLTMGTGSMAVGNAIRNHFVDNLTTTGFDIKGSFAGSGDGDSLSYVFYFRVN